MKKNKRAPAAPSRTGKQPTTVLTVLTDEEIDDRVVAQAEDDAAWDPPVHVSRKQAKVGLSASLSQRAAFLARLHHERDLQAWVERVVRERVEIEERAFTQARREYASKTGA